MYATEAGQQDDRVGQPELRAVTSPPPASPRARARTGVIIADGDPLARRILRDAFQRAPGMLVVAEASDGVEAVELALHYRPDVVLCEMAIGRLNGVEVTRRIVERAPEVRVLFFAVSADPQNQLAALRAGASGYVSKAMAVEDVVAAVGCVVRGEAVVSTEIVHSLLQRLQRMPSAGSGMRPVSSRLTPREWEVLDRISAGCSTDQVAAELGLAADTVYSHMKNVMRKLGVRTRAEAIQVADRICRGAGDDEAVA